MTGTAVWPAFAHAQIGTNDGEPAQSAPSDLPRVQPTRQEQAEQGAVSGADNAQGAIVPDVEFEAALPSLSGDIDAPLEPMDAFETEAPPAAGAGVLNAPPAPSETIADAPPIPDPELDTPLQPLAGFDVTPVEVQGVEDTKIAGIDYALTVQGLEAVDLEGEFKDLSALREGDGKAETTAMLTARAKEDEQLAVRLMQSVGYYDGTALTTLEQPGDAGEVQVTLTAEPGALYHIGSIAIDAPPTRPADLIRDALPLKVGDPIDAALVQAAEANVSLTLPQQGYPFAEVGQRDILLDERDHLGAYTLPVATGPRASFGGYTTSGDLAFDAEHVGVLARFERGELYDSRKVDDLRQALVATGLFSSVAVEPAETGETAPDGTEYVNLHVTQNAGPPRTLAGEAGYGTGQGLRVEASWTHRNLFPPEGALILSGVGGTQEQGVSATFRRSNAGRRDRSFQAKVEATRGDFDAYEGYTGTLSARWAYESTPIWQKRFTYAYGGELVATSENPFDFALGKRDRKTFFIAALPAQGQWDESDDLLNPTRGFRVKANVSPEASVQGAARPYARIMIEGTAYYPVSDSLVIAGRARAGSIPGIERNDLAPSRRYYAGGGGSVRGFGYQELGPRAPDGDPIGGRSLNEFAIEARYRFGNFGIVPFVDAGQVYEGVLPKGSDLRFGAGIGGRFYTNFGPLRVDVATPIARKKGESAVSLYISIGQAF